MAESHEPLSPWTCGAAAVSGALLVAILVGLMTITPPEVVPESAPDTEFSAVRAREHLQCLTRAPHAVGWPEHERVRSELLHRLEALGLEVHEREATALERAEPVNSPVAIARVRNVLARLPGREPGAKALLLMAHYDSTPDTFGTSDDGFGVAALLETARALKAGPAPRHDILFLFTDGEELGLLGARSFVEEDPLRARVGLVLNFEARGNRGPVVAFQSSPGNGWLIEQLAHTPHPLASSLSQAVYTLLPNDTDLTEFLAAGIPGLNFANIQGFGHYHSMTDTLGAADMRTLQHHGSYALSLARRFAELPLHEQPKTSDAVFFNAGPLLVHYPVGVSYWLTALAACALLGVLLRYRHAWTGKELLIGAVSQLAMVLAAVLPVVAVDFLLWEPFSRGPLIDGNTPWASALHAAGILGVALVTPCFLAAHLLRRYAAPRLALGALLVWLALTVALTFALPVASYLLQLPLLCAVATCALSLAAKQPSGPLWPAGALAILLFPGVALVASLAGLLDAAADLAVPSAFLAALLMGAFLPQLGMLLDTWRRLPQILAFLGALGLVMAGIVGQSDGDQRWPGRVFYALDGDSGEALWLKPDKHGDAWTQAFFETATSQEARKFFPRSRREQIPGLPAPTAAVPLPELKLLSEQRVASARRLELEAQAAGAPVLELFASPEARISEAQVDGKRVPLLPSGALSVRYWAVPTQGIRLTLKTEAPGPLSLRLVSWRPGVPAPPSAEGSNLQWEEFRGSQHTLASRALSF